MIRKSPNIAVITGGPGSGKTTLCEQLFSEGIAVGCESGRAVLARAEGHDLRQQRPDLYALEILTRDLENFKGANAGFKTWLFDRGFPDNVGFLELMGLSIPDELALACRDYRYTGPIFVAPPWQEIYHVDDDRIQDWQEAKATYAAVKAAWENYGYDLIELPKASVEKRVSFIWERLA